MRNHTRQPTLKTLASLVALFVCACADTDEAGRSVDLPYATEVVSFTPGPGAGWGQEFLPDVVLGPPDGASLSVAASGRDQVLSLGAGGEIVLGFGGGIVDGPGADFVVFENPFWVRGDPEVVWAELGEVAVSEDGVTWHVFPCQKDGGTAPGTWPGCAGWAPTRMYDPVALVPLDPLLSGGNAFDLADLGVKRARFIRIRDLLDSANSELENVGFDLDAVGVVHLERKAQ